METNWIKYEWNLLPSIYLSYKMRIIVMWVIKGLKTGEYELSRVAEEST